MIDNVVAISNHKKLIPCTHSTFNKLRTFSTFCDVTLLSARFCCELRVRLMISKSHIFNMIIFKFNKTHTSLHQLNIKNDFYIKTLCQCKPLFDQVFKMQKEKYIRWQRLVTVQNIYQLKTKKRHGNLFLLVNIEKIDFKMEMTP